jgi:hypothetical protein
MRTWLIGSSLAVHLAVIFGLFVAGMWHVEQLDPAKHRIDLAVALPPPPAASGSPTPRAQTITPKRHIVHELVVPEHVAPTPAAETSEVPGTGSGTGSGSGSDVTGIDGPCTENCGPGSAAPQKTPECVGPQCQQTMVPPTVLRGLRISGNTQIQPNDMLKAQLDHEGKTQLDAMFKVCVDTAGTVSAVSQLRSTGYASYDTELAAAIHAWRYQPYLANHVPIPVCGVVTFKYGMK